MNQIVIMGTPIAQARPRFSTLGKRPRAISEQAKEKRRYQWEIRSQFRVVPLSGPVAIAVEYYMLRPAGKPDLDNLVKWTLDCMTGICFIDDSQVIAIEASKRYSTNPNTVIEISGRLP